jgi:hypothetical protein
LLGFGAALLLGAGSVVELTVVVERPRLGEITHTLETVWTGLLGFATLASFLLALYNAASGETSNGRPPREFRFGGNNDEVEYHLHFNFGESRTKTTENESTSEKHDGQANEETNSGDGTQTESTEEPRNVEDS